MTNPDFHPVRFEELRKLQQVIGEGNAAKGFHEEGQKVRALLESSRDIEAKLPGVGVAKGSSVELFESTLRNYWTARLALITTEVAEAIEELRNGRQVDETYYPTYSETDGTDQLAGVHHKPEGVPSEVADVVIRAFDFAHEAEFDLAAIIEEKLAYNATRVHKHGREF